MWGELGIEPTADATVIRRAYAQRLRAIDPDRDPAAFQRLREAYEAALSSSARDTGRKTRRGNRRARRINWSRRRTSRRRSNIIGPRRDPSSMRSIAPWMIATRNARWRCLTRRSRKAFCR